MGRDDGLLIGVLGGGQLGRMLALSGIPLGLHFRFLDPSPSACAADVGDLVVGALDDREALDELVAGCDAVTYEWEGVPADSVEYLSQRFDGTPHSESLRTSQDRLFEKQLFASLGIATAPYAVVGSAAELTAALDDVGLPAILKTRRGGYDGRGQALIESRDEVETSIAALSSDALIVEGLVKFDRELSVIGSRGADGNIVVYPVAHNEHRDGILRVTRAPVDGLEPAITGRAETIVREVMTATKHVGTLCVELFQVGNTLVANEMAPRVHNSGHWTIEGAAASQFENHLRAVLGWPLGSAAELGACAMANCIGRLPDLPSVFAIRGAHLHRYGKSPRRGRKVGHVTIAAPRHDALESALAQVVALISDDG